MELEKKVALYLTTRDNSGLFSPQERLKHENQPKYRGAVALQTQ